MMWETGSTCEVVPRKKNNAVQSIKTKLSPFRKESLCFVALIVRHSRLLVLQFRIFLGSLQSLRSLTLRFGCRSPNPLVDRNGRCRVAQKSLDSRYISFIGFAMGTRFVLVRIGWFGDSLSKKRSPRCQHTRNGTSHSMRRAGPSP